MARNPYGTYRGRASWGKRILIGIVVLLVIALILAVVGVVFLRDNIVYTDRGIEFTLPFGKKDPTPSAAGETSPLPTESELVIETPSSSPSPSPSPTAKPVMYPRRDTPLGLVTMESADLLDKAAGEKLSANQGAVFSTYDDGLYDEANGDTIRENNLALPYSAVAVMCDWHLEPGEEKYREKLVDECERLAGLAFDELVLMECGYPLDSPHSATAEEMSDFYARVRERLDKLGYQGRLSVVCFRGTIVSGTDATTHQPLDAVAKYFDRVYFPAGINWPEGTNLYRILKEKAGEDGAFTKSTTADIVTVVASPISANYAWATLPGVENVSKLPFMDA